MRIFWYVLALFAFVGMAVIVFFKNVPRFVHNLFYKDKRRYWHPVDALFPDGFDDTERIYY
jgi:hypothetical protein